MDPDTGYLPERVIRNLLQIGVDAVTANPALLDRILGTHMEGAEEIAKVRATWARETPRVMVGYPRKSTDMPCYAITLGGDNPNQAFVGMSEHGWEDDAGGELGNQFVERVKADFVVYVYASHPDVCVWYYRVLRRIVNVGRRYLIERGLHDPVISGAELAPDPQYDVENLFVRRLTVSVEYDDTWTDHDPLWLAINGTPEAFGSEYAVFHEDVPGGVVPVPASVIAAEEVDP